MTRWRYESLTLIKKKKKIPTGRYSLYRGFMKKGCRVCMPEEKAQFLYGFSADVEQGVNPDKGNQVKSLPGKVYPLSSTKNLNGANNFLHILHVIRLDVEI